MIKDYLQGFTYVFKGFSLILRKGVRPYAFVPLLVNIVIFSLAIYTGFTQFGDLMDSFLGSISWMPDWLEQGISWILWPLFAILITIATYYSFTMVANLIAAPFNSALAHKVETLVRGNTGSTEAEHSVVAVAGRTIASEIKKLGHMLKWLILLLIITVIPGINVISPFAWMLYGVWMLALEYADYPMGNHELYFKEELTVLRRSRFTALGFGSGVMLLTTIPVVNFLAMPVSVAGAAALWVDRLDRE